MGLHPDYENDFFISYTHNDNLPVRSVRWVELLHSELENRLTMLLGKRPRIWRDLLGFEFCRQEQASGDYLEFNPSSDEFDGKLQKLAQGMARLIQNLLNSQPKPRSTAAEKTIYLAETTSDLSAEYINIKNEFESCGYNILPSAPLSRELTGEELQAQINQYLQGAKLSVHLLGMRQGFIPEGATHSIVHLQHDLARAHAAADKEFKRILWIPQGLEEADGTEKPQQEFIAGLLRDPVAQASAELSRDIQEHLKALIHNHFKPPPDPVARFNGNQSLASIYLVCNQDDYDEASMAQEYLLEKRYEVLPPLLDGENSLVAQYHRECLLECDAFLIYFNRASEVWAQMKRLELIKLPGMGRTKPVRAKAFYISGEIAPHKERFRSAEARVIRNYGEFSPHALSPFLEDL